jgi:N-acetylmuramoyl-L-alanine amidase
VRSIADVSHEFLRLDGSIAIYHQGMRWNKELSAWIESFSKSDIRFQVNPAEETRMNASSGGAPLVDWTARRISDPVLRLRFLKAAAPVWQPAPKTHRWRWRQAGMAVTALLLVLAAVRFLDVRKARASGVSERSPGMQTEIPAPAFIPAGVSIPKEQSPQEIWPVEQTAAFETYSNGLRIDNKFATGNHPRSYLTFAANQSNFAADRRTAPAGIVFHTTESLQAPFEPDQNGKLVKVGEALIEYVKRKKAYNFVIDRFGRVFRVVREADAAEHAGYSVWSDEKWLYVNLNESFLGVAVETRTQPGQSAAAITEAQIRAIAMLTEMLRRRFGISAGNCVTHAQVSVSPTRMLAGYHMDWASSFPFEAVGLPDNYARPLPSVAQFGFDCDGNYARTAGFRLWEGARLGSQELSRRAAAAGMSVVAFRKEQQRRYRERLAATRGAATSHEGD